MNSSGHEPNNQLESTSKKSAKKKLIKDTLVYGFGGIVGQLAAILLLPLYTRYLSPADYGTMDIIEKVSSIVNICLMTGGIRQALFAFYLQAKDKAEQDRVAPTVGVFLLLSGTVALLLLAAIAPFASNWMGIESPSLLVFGFAAGLGELALVIPFSLMQARIESVLFVTMNLVTLVTRVLLILFFLVVLQWGIWGFYAAVLINSYSFGLFLTFRELSRGSWHLDRSNFKNIFNFSLPFIPTGILFFVLYNGDRFFLLGNGGTTAVGLYALGCKIASGVGMLSFTPLFKVWSARMYEVFDRADGGIIAGKVFTHILTAYCFVAVAVCLFQQEVIFWFLDSDFQNASVVVPVVVLANIFLFYSNFAECVFYVHKKTKYKPLTALVATLVIMMFYVVLIPQFSIMGAAWATVIGYLTLAIVTLSIAQRIAYVKYEYAKIAALLCTSALCVVLTLTWPIGIKESLLKLAVVTAWVVLAFQFKFVDFGKVKSYTTPND